MSARIRRIGLDTVTNYTLLATSAYDAAHPAATTAAWPNVAAMDQPLTYALANTVEITEQGCLVTFARGPFLFTGVVVKVRPTYDLSISEAPSLEVWTHNEISTLWTIRRKIDLTNLIVGVASGQLRYFTIFFVTPLTHVDMVWVTMNPGLTGAPTMRFDALHLFGECELLPETPGGCGTGTSIDCLPPLPPPDLLPPDNDPYVPPPTPPLLPGVPVGPVDPNWPTLPPDAGGPTQPFTPPNFPAIDLCDPAAVAAFKALLTPDQLSYFEELLSTVELPCLVPPPPGGPPARRDPQEVAPIVPASSAQPQEVYVDPVSLVPSGDPRADETGPLSPAPQVPGKIPDGPTALNTTVIHNVYTTYLVSEYTDVQFRTSLLNSSGGTPANNLSLAAQLEAWNIIRIAPRADLPIATAFRVRYDGFLADANVVVQAAVSGPNASGAFGVVPFFVPSGLGPPTSAPDDTTREWDAQTTGADILLTVSNDDQSGVPNPREIVILRVTFVQQDIVTNPRIEVL